MEALVIAVLTLFLSISSFYSGRASLLDLNMKRGDFCEGCALNPSCGAGAPIQIKEYGYILHRFDRLVKV
jgi:hypothetical protein